MPHTPTDSLHFSVKSILARELGAIQEADVRVVLDERVLMGSEALRISPYGDTHLALQLTRAPRDLELSLEATIAYEFTCDSCGQRGQGHADIETQRACVRPVNWDTVEDEAEGSLLIEATSADADQTINLREVIAEELLLAQPMKLLCAQCQVA